MKGRRNNRLMIDSVIGSQPELGPAPPNGGYGWIILFGVMLVQVTIPSILVTSGLLIFDMLDSNPTFLTTNDVHWIWLPTIYCAVWNLMDPWSLTMTSVVNGSGMSVLGILLVSSGLLAASLIHSSVDIFYICLGFLAGIGASMTTIQSEYLLQKYFSTKLPVVQTIYQMGHAAGEILMPILIGSLLNKFGFSSTLLLQGGITLQALIGAALFKKPRYKRSVQNSTAYTLLKNEDTEDNKNNGQNEPDILQKEDFTQIVSHKTVPYSEHKEESDDELILTKNTDEESPVVHSLPRPLFSDVDLAGSSQNTAFFIEESDEDVDLYVQRGGFTRRNIPCSQEMKMLLNPLFYCGLSIMVITKISMLAFWTLLPLVLKSKLPDFQPNQAIFLLSIGGIANFCSATVSYWLPVLSARHRKIIFIISAYIAAGGLFLLGYGCFWMEMVCAALLIRLGTSGVIYALQHVLRDTMGASEVAKTHTLLNIFTGLLMMIGMMTISSNFEVTFKILAWIQLAAGSVWCLQSFFNRLCNK